MTYSGNCRLGDLFSNRRQNGRADVPTLSVTLNNGLVPREDLDRKQETSLAPEEHLLVRPGDIAYNMMRMWQGALGLATQEGLVSPAYVVLSPTRKVDPLYAYHFLKSSRSIYLLWAYSHGLTDDRLRLYYDDFAKIPATIPSVDKQVFVGKLLSTWDRTLQITGELSGSSRQQKAALMQKLLSATVGKKHANKNWQTVRLGSLFSERVETQRPDLPLLSITREDGVIPRGKVSDKDVSSVDKSNYRRICPGDIGYNTMRMWQGISALSSLEGIVSPAYTIVTPNKHIHDRFAAQLFKFNPVIFQFYRYSQGLVSDTWNLNFGDFSKIQVRIPHAEKQRQIAAVLDAADEVIRTIDGTMNRLEQEKRALMQRLLSPRALTGC